MRIVPLIALVSLSGLVAGAALGAVSRATVSQKGRMFSVERLEIRKGESLTFLNDDSVPHNIVSRSAGNEFDLGPQPTGAATDVTFAVAGEAKVVCAIHPRMRMTVKIVE
jgi:plastocyanin